MIQGEEHLQRCGYCRAKGHPISECPYRPHQYDRRSLSVGSVEAHSSNPTTYASTVKNNYSFQPHQTSQKSLHQIITNDSKEQHENSEKEKKLVSCIDKPTSSTQANSSNVSQDTPESLESENSSAEMSAENVTTDNSFPLQNENFEKHSLTSQEHNSSNTPTPMLSNTDLKPVDSLFDEQQGDSETDEFSESDQSESMESDHTITNEHFPPPSWNKVTGKRKHSKADSSSSSGAKKHHNRTKKKKTPK